MALKYDYDICWTAPDGPEQEAEPAFRATFRDPATAEALRKAEPGLRSFFEASGFGLDVFDSGAPDDCFPAADLTARNDITERLAENLAKFEFDDETGPFSFAEFLDYEFRARPVETVVQKDVDRASRSRPKLSSIAFGGLIARLKAGAAPRLASVNPRVLGVAVLMIFLVPFIAQAMGRL